MVCGVVGGVRYDGVGKGRFVLMFVGVRCMVATHCE